MFYRLFRGAATVRRQRWVERPLHVVKWLTHKRRQSRNKSDIWELIRRFSGEDLHDELAGPNINRLENVLTLGLIERIFFRKLEIWFQATVRSQPSHYPFFVT